MEAVEELPHEGVRVALIPCGDARIELLESTADESPIAKFLSDAEREQLFMAFKRRMMAQNR